MQARLYRQINFHQSCETVRRRVLHFSSATLSVPPRQALIAAGVASALALCAVALIASSNSASRVEALAIRHIKAGPGAVASKVNLFRKHATRFKITRTEIVAAD
jgi:hypothetical protein